jgi:hypothetical protein
MGNEHVTDMIGIIDEIDILRAELEQDDIAVLAGQAEQKIQRVAPEFKKAADDRLSPGPRRIHKY